MKIKNYRAIFISAFLLVVLFSASFYAFYLIQKSNLQQAQLAFNNQAIEVTSIISSRVNRDVYLLYSLRGLYAASKSVERNEFQAFGDGFDVKNNFPGIYAIGFVQKVPASEKDSYAESVKADTSIQAGGYPDFALYPERMADNYYPLQYVYPADIPIEKIGYDFGADDNLKATMQTALEKNTAIVSDKIAVDGEDSPFYIIMVPIFQNGQPTDTLEQRQANLEGYAGVMVKTDKFFDSIVQTEKINWERADMYVYDSAPEKIADLDEYIYDLDKEQSEDSKTEVSPLSNNMSLIVANKVWTLRLVAKENFGLNQLDENLKWVFLILSILGSLLVSVFVYYLTTSRRRALTAAEEITKELRDNEEKYRTILDNVEVGIYRNTLENGGDFLEANPAMIKIFGFSSKEELMKVKVADLYPSPKEREPIVKKLQTRGFINKTELKLKKKDGKIIWATLTARAHRNEDGEIKWVDGAIEDITAEKEFKDQEKKKSEELEKINRIMSSRELKMVELKREIESLKNNPKSNV